jgi:hypothetical protein
VDVDSKRSVTAVKQLEKFQNGKLNKLVLKSLKTKLTFASRRRDLLKKPTSVILFCFFFPENGSQQSYLTFLHL